MTMLETLVLGAGGLALAALVMTANRRRRSDINPLHSQTPGDTDAPMMFMGDSSSDSSADCADGSSADSGGCDGGGGDGGGGGGD